jgi:simple sugar transport system ATP-binding protein
MVGSFDAHVPPPPPPPAAGAVHQLELARVSAADDRGVPALVDVDLAVRAGEIFGIAGVDGNGQTELFEVLAGMRSPARGSVAVGETPVTRFEPAAMSAIGIAAIPPDRQRQGIVADMTVRENALLSAALVRQVSPGILTRPETERRVARAMIEQYAIKTASLEAPARTLSGGNIQKLIIARALALQPRVLIAVNPTRGLDIAASRAVYAAFALALARGAAVLLISTDLDEILAHAHRLAVLYRGRLSPPLEPPFPTARVGALMAGSSQS